MITRAKRRRSDANLVQTRSLSNFKPIRSPATLPRAHWAIIALLWLLVDPTFCPLISNDGRRGESCGAKSAVFWLHYPPTPRERRWGVKRCRYSETRLLSTQKRKSRSEKRDHSVAHCPWKREMFTFASVQDKRYCEALLRPTWHGPETWHGRPERQAVSYFLLHSEIEISSN